MKKFLIQLSILIVILFASFLFVFSYADGYADHSYLRFTSATQNSLIIGVSKAAQGLHPQILNKIIGRKDIYNFAFNAYTSPYGKTYYESIKRKVNKSNKDGIFILSVDAWSLGSKTDDPNDSINFRELKGSLNSRFISMNPNVPYLLNHYENKYIDIFRSQESRMFLHDNGWLEVSIKMDSISKDERLQHNLEHYKKNYLPYWKFSSSRLHYLSKTIKYLKKYGQVYIVRLPVHQSFLDMENYVTPNFDEIIIDLSEELKIPYLNFSKQNKNYEFSDGVHLGKKSGTSISTEIGTLIKNSQEDESDKFKNLVQ